MAAVLPVKTLGDNRFSSLLVISGSPWLVTAQLQVLSFPQGHLSLVSVSTILVKIRDPLQSSVTPP